MQYRHEMKFLVSEQQIAILRARLQYIMRQDVHQNNGIYNIRSLYFDDFRNSCLEDNEDGVDNRKKYRIRIYDKKDSVIKLEKKIKYRGMTRKIGTSISREDCLLYMANKVPELNDKCSELEKELYVQMKGNGAFPVTIVEYERTAFVEEKGNVRVTFDRNISGCNKIGSFLEEHIPLVPVLPKGQHVLEVKYDEYLPQYIGDILEIGSLQRTAFSKYGYARKCYN